MVNTGYRQSLYFGNETNYGSAAVINQPIGLVQSINPTETNNLMKVRTLGGSRDYSNIVAGKFEVSGSFDYYLQGGNFLRMAMGEDTGTSATIDSGPRVHSGASYLHIMGSAASPQTDSFPSFTLELADAEDSGAAVDTANLKRLFTGCRVNTASISATVDEPVSVSVDWIGQSVTMSTAAATSVSDSTKDPYVFYQGAVYSTSGAVSAYTDLTSYGTQALCQVNSLDFSVNNNLEATWYISGTCSVYQTLRGLKHLIVKGRDYEASLGLHFKNKSQYQRFLGAASATTPQATLGKFQIVTDFARSSYPGATPKAATDDYIRIVMASCAFDTENITGAPEDIVNESIGVFVKSAKVYVVDTDASYLS